MQLIRTFKGNALEIQPVKYMNNYDQICTTCKSKVKIYQSIKVCQCQLTVHKVCFIEKLKPDLEQFSRFRCKECRQQINFSFKYSYRFTCQIITIPVLIFLSLSLLILSLTVLLTFLEYYVDFLSSTTIYIFCGILILILTLILLHQCIEITLQQIDITEKKVHPDKDESQFKISDSQMINYKARYENHIEK